MAEWTDELTKIAWMFPPGGFHNYIELPYWTTDTTNNLTTQSVVLVAFDKIFILTNNISTYDTGEIAGEWDKYWSDHVLYSYLNYTGYCLNYAGGYRLPNISDYYYVNLRYVDPLLNLDTYFSSGETNTPNSNIYTDSATSNMFVNTEFPFDFSTGGVTNFNVASFKLYKLQDTSQSKDLFTLTKESSGSYGFGNQAIYHNFSQLSPLHCFQSSDDIIIVNNFTNNTSSAIMKIRYRDGYGSAYYYNNGGLTNLPRSSIANSVIYITNSITGTNHITLDSFHSFVTISTRNPSNTSFTATQLDLTGLYVANDNFWVTLQNLDASFEDWYGNPDHRAFIPENVRGTILTNITNLADKFIQAQVFDNWNPYFTLGSSYYDVNVISNLYYTGSGSYSYGPDLDDDYTTYADALAQAYSTAYNEMNSNITMNINGDMTKWFQVGASHVGDNTEGNASVNMKYRTPLIYKIIIKPIYEPSFTNLFTDYEYEYNCYARISGGDYEFDDFGLGYELDNIYPMVSTNGIDAGTWLNMHITNTVDDYDWHEPTSFDVSVFCNIATNSSVTTNVNLPRTKFYNYLKFTEK